MYQKCPICEGRGIVPAGFYTLTESGYHTDLTEQCRQCDGKGMLNSVSPTEQKFGPPPIDEKYEREQVKKFLTEVSKDPVTANSIENREV